MIFTALTGKGEQKMPDREKVINGLREMSCRATWKDIDRIRHEYQPIINDAIDLLKEQPEIIRCKDCKYGEHMCKPWSDIICNQNRATHIPDWFCADGKRKEI